ncbi:MAG: HlyD family type I secretion periplasmic adaptor subunit [Pirellulaceae bacterium]|nr:HlyD family type I secretion periplasmic adaptor subunit [Pirellulaceae bacterium]
MSEIKEPTAQTNNGGIDPEQRETLKQGIAKAVADRVQAAREGRLGPNQGADTKASGASAVATKKPQPAENEKLQKIGPVFVDFQPDAIELEVTPVPGGLRWVLYTVTLFLLTTVAWAYWTKLETFVVAQGKLVPISEPVLIQATSGSPVRQIHVRFGDIVRAGDLLATLDATIPQADFESLSSRLHSAEARMARLLSEQSGAETFELGTNSGSPYWQAEAALFRSRQLAMESQIAEIAAEISGFNAKTQGNTEEIAGLQDALAIHRQVEERLRGLVEKGAQTETAYLSQKLNRQEADLKINNLVNQNKQLQHELTASRKRQQRVTVDRMAEVNEKIVETSKEINVLKADLDKAIRMIELSELRVPTDLPYDEFFVLEASERTTGSVVRETDPLFKLMPTKDPLRIEAEVAGKDIGEIRIDDPVVIKLDALPYQKHGTLKGHLATISEGAFEKKEGQPETTFFKSYVTLDDRTIQNKPMNFRIVPGMTCKVEIRVGSRRVIDYFLYPLFRHMDESLREPSPRAQ